MNMGLPVSGTNLPTKTTTITATAPETAMTSLPDDDTMSVSTGYRGPGAPPPSGPNTVIVELVKPSALNERLRNVQSGARSTPAASVVGAQDVPMITVGGGDGGELHPEHTVWPDVVDEQLVNGLHRLVQYAKDMNARDPSKTVEQYYSERLAKLIKEGTIQFDLGSLK